ncbi:hypothetical protein M430DRAFT_34708 [Amorphotheca resinae ATCC 22711]|uniref:Uncharacterized protein n=1 Tax=Amorphotheca resinae ATCC 22711 TaxID=857342 RepID=A0A2T3B465_AMORE|nr:hypothetical protein M430DRAFT_34708 [Amorphotheca resinae ATCC 22711]PSS20426.1 hypothetical protein M430DRAFT_34708 [Amorphotheca resinae ATCC 22711]
MRKTQQQPRRKQLRTSEFLLVVPSCSAGRGKAGQSCTHRDAVAMTDGCQGSSQRFQNLGRDDRGDVWERVGNGMRDI